MTKIHIKIPPRTLCLTSTAFFQYTCIHKDGLDGLQREQSILVAKGNVVKVKKAFQGRVTLPGYPDNRYNASLALTGLRSSDSGMYRCEVVVGINDEQDTVPLQVTGKPAPRNANAHVRPCP